jgi:hypothetical protein
MTRRWGDLRHPNAPEPSLTTGAHVRYTSIRFLASRATQIRCMMAGKLPLRERQETHRHEVHSMACLAYVQGDWQDLQRIFRIRSW